MKTKASKTSVQRGKAKFPNTRIVRGNKKAPKGERIKFGGLEEAAAVMDAHLGLTQLSVGIMLTGLKKYVEGIGFGYAAGRCQMAEEALRSALDEGDDMPVGAFHEILRALGFRIAIKVLEPDRTQPALEAGMERASLQTDSSVARKLLRK